MNRKLRNHDEVVLEQLLNPEMAKSYLDVALEEYEQDGDLAFFLEALRNVVEARSGMTNLAEKTGLNRQNLYRVLSPEGKEGTANHQPYFAQSRLSFECATDSGVIRAVKGLSYQFWFFVPTF